MAKRVFKKKPQRKGKVVLHHSFKRSYREDYKRDLNIPGIMAHFFETFRTIFSNWKLFVPLIFIIVGFNVLLVGIMSEDAYTQFKDILDQTNESVGNENMGTITKASLILVSTITTGGLSTEISDAQGVFAAILLLVVWLVTIYLVRHIKAGHKIKLRDAFYNACTPLISTFLILLLILIQCIPIFIFIIAYSTAIQTQFISTPFYALVFFIFAVTMFLLSGYWLSSSLIALVSVSAPGLYPLKAVHAASDLMAGRRIRFLARVVGLFILLIIIWTTIMLPIIIFDGWLKTFEWAAGIPLVPICLSIMTIFTIIYSSAYLYIYYRWVLDSEKEKQDE